MTDRSTVVPTRTVDPARGAPRRARAALLLPILVGLAGVGAPIGAQERDSIPGVSLGLIYESNYQPPLAIKPFTARFGGGSAAPQVEAIMARDLRYSDRFEVLDSLPPSLVGEGIDYTLWDQLGAVWLLTGQVEGSGDGYVLLLEVHDVVYGEVKEAGRFPLPEPSESGFRMAVHRASDAVVQWIFNEPGMAASRIAFSIRGEGAGQELWVIDSDGENLRRITNHENLTLGPAWSPDGHKLAYVSFTSGNARIYERNLETGEDRLLDVNKPGQFYTPAYSPDGSEIAFAVTGSDRSGIFAYDLERACCLRELAGGRWDDLSPTWSPDGRRIAFNSNRLGTAAPQIYVMPAGGGEPDLISPYRYGQAGYYTSPDWSPTGDRVAFHGRVERGRYQILVADVDGRNNRLRQLTWEGNNEDPSWAPDGRHLVFVGERSYGRGLFVVDGATGRIRSLVTGRDVRVPAWSPSLRGSEGATLRGEAR